jgi:hypothetical protein
VRTGFFVNEIVVDPNLGAGVVNYSDLDTEEVLTAAMHQNPEIAELVTWTRNTQRNGRSRSGGLFDRDRFVCPDNPIQQMRTAVDATNDDVVAAYLDSSEAMAIRNMECNVADDDEDDIWEQILEDCDLEERMREIWREIATVSQCYVAAWYETKDYTVRGKSDQGVRRKKQYKGLTVPVGLTILDPFKVVPVGNFLFGQETLCYFADPTERDVIDSWLLGDDDSEADGIIKRLIVSKYEPDFRDRKELGNLGVDPNRLYIMNPRYVWRITATRPGYQRFSPVRMTSIFEVLDLKHQLRQSDRATLIGASNFILLVKKGTDKEPAKRPEIEALQGNMRSVSKVPVIVGDHRLSIEIITPKTDNTLDTDRYTILDLRIMGRLYGMFISTHSGRDDSLKLARVVARGLESRRESIIKSLMVHLIKPTFALNAQLENPPNLEVHPKRIALDFDPSLATYLLDLRDRGDLSRDSILSEIDYDEDSEAQKRKIEAEKYDDIFQPPVPLAGAPAAPGATAPPAPGAPNDPKRAGRAQGGNHGQGGNGNVGRGAGLPPRRPGKGAGIQTEPKLDDSDS